MDYNEAAMTCFAVGGLATLVMIYLLPSRSPLVLVPLIGYVAAGGVVSEMAPKVELSVLLGLATVTWIAGAAVTLATIWASGALYRRYRARTVYRRPGGLP